MPDSTRDSRVRRTSSSPPPATPAGLVLPQKRTALFGADFDCFWCGERMFSAGDRLVCSGCAWVTDEAPMTWAPHEVGNTAEREGSSDE
jgi:hypothetical protein